MAYVVARRGGGRFEVRESVHTAKGPRSRTLASFTALDEEVLSRARARARRPFDVHAVLASARRAGAPEASRTPVRVAAGHGGGSRGPAGDTKARVRFLEASRRMARTIGASARGEAPAGARDPGEALIELLGFVDAVRAVQPPRPAQRLAFPPLGKIARAGRSPTR